MLFQPAPQVKVTLSPTFGVGVFLVKSTQAKPVTGDGLGVEVGVGVGVGDGVGLGEASPQEQS